MNEAQWPDSLRPLYTEAAGASLEAAVSSRGQWKTQLAQWVRGASLDERIRAQEAAWSRLGAGDPTPGELLFLLSHCGELLWPYSEAPKELLPRLTQRQEALAESLRAASQGDTAPSLQRETGEEIAKVLARYLKRHPDAWTVLVGDVRWTFDGKKVRFNETVELDIKRVLGAGPRALERLDQLRSLLSTSRKESRDRVVGLIQNQAIRMGWQDVRGELEEKLFQLALVPGNRSAVRTFLACYPEGKKEPGWCARASLLLAQHLGAEGDASVIESLCELLSLFESPPVDSLRGALNALVSALGELKDLGKAGIVADHCWNALRPDEPGLMLVMLWLEEQLFRAGTARGAPEAFERRNRVREQLRDKPLAEPLCWLAEECAELWARFGSGRRPGPDELAGWRQEVTKRFGRKPALRKAAMELFLWCAPDEAASEAELVTLALLRTATDKRNLRRWGEHPSARVRSRVRAIHAWLQAGPSGALEAQQPATLTSALRHLRAASAVTLGGGRTWLRDRDLEELLHGAIARVERDFSARYPEHFREGGTELVARLLEGLKQEFQSIEADLSALLTRGQATPLSLEFRYTKRSDAEGEGRAEARASGVEVAFLLDVDVGHFLRTKRAAFVQVGRLEERGAGQWAPSFRLSRERVEALLGRTESAFCLFLVPPFSREECWVLPARLVRGLMEAQDSVAVVSREAVQRATRSLAQWLTYELIGLWTGDERPAVVESARGAEASAPDFLVELSIRKA
jgi:hypothetical protein